MEEGGKMGEIEAWILMDKYLDIICQCCFCHFECLNSNNQL